MLQALYFVLWFHFCLSLACAVAGVFERASFLIHRSLVLTLCSLVSPSSCLWYRKHVYVCVSGDKFP